MKLAIYGGTPVRTTPFRTWPYYGKEEEINLLRALNHGQWWRMDGPENVAFENEFAEYHGAYSALAVSNGTSALEIALLTLDIGPGDEVIVPAFTFISTSMAVQRVGAVAIAADIDLETYCLDVRSVESLITERTKAIIPVHMSGAAADIIGLKALADKHHLRIIHDAAHAHGMIYKGRRVGEWDDIACFSFQNFKLMTSGEGGALLFPNEALREKAFRIHNCGRPQGDRKYQHSIVGSNYRLNEFSAAILSAQLGRLPEQNRLRDERGQMLDDAFAEIDGIIPQARPDEMDIHPKYMIMFRLDREILPNTDRSFVVDALIAEGLPAYRSYAPIYWTDAYWQAPCPEGDRGQMALQCPNTETIGSDGVWIHHRVLLEGEEAIDHISSAVKKVVAACLDSERKSA